MAELFLKTVNMSFSAGWLILAVILARVVLKRAPKWIHVLLWGIVAVRLVCPFSFESILSLIPSAEVISPRIMTAATPQLHTGIEAINSAVNPILSQSFSPSPEASVNPLQLWIPVLAVLWLAGAAAMAAYSGFSFLGLKRKLREAVVLRDRIFLSENAASPFILGILKPKVYLPYGMEAGIQTHVIAHELAHIRRKDHWWKPLGFTLLSLHWFNPLMWIAYILLCRDIEMACDEKVIRQLGTQQRADYSQALLTCSIRRGMIAACPLAFGEVGVKQRIKSVLHYKKPAFWIILVALILCAAVAVCFLTDPKEDAGAYDGYMLSVRIWDGSSVKEGEPRWNYFEIQPFSGVTLPGTNSVGLSLEELGPEGLLLSFDTPLMLEGEPHSELWLEMGELVELVTPTPGGCTWYGFSIVEESFTFANYPPLEALPEDYSLQQAKEDGCVVMENGDVSSGKEVWWNFYQAVQDGIPSGVRYVTYFTMLDPSRYSSEYYESHKDSYPRMYVHDLVFDGEAFQVRWYEDGELIRREYQYLLRFQDVAETKDALHDSYVRYVLTNKVVSSWMEIFMSLASSQAGVAIDHMSTYVNLIYSWEPKYGELYAAQRALEPYMEEYKIVSIGVNQITWTVDIQVSEQVEGLEALAAEVIDPAYVRIRQQEGELRPVAASSKLQSLVDDICSSPLHRSDPGAYIEAHPQAYGALLSYGNDALRWCFEKFLKGGETGLPGHIMAIACEEIMLGWGEAYLIDEIDRMTGQDWFDEFLSLAKGLREQYEEEQLRKDYPGAWTVLSMVK